MNYIKLFVISFIFIYGSLSIPQARPNRSNAEVNDSIMRADKRLPNELKKISIRAIDTLLELEYKIKILSTMKLVEKRHQPAIERNRLRISEVMIRLRLHKNELNSVLDPLLKLRQIQYFGEFQRGVEKAQTKSLKKRIDQGLDTLRNPLVRHFLSNYFEHLEGSVKPESLLDDVATALLLSPEDLQLYTVQKIIIREALEDRLQSIVDNKKYFNYKEDLNSFNHRLMNISREVDYIWFNDTIINQNPSFVERLTSYVKQGRWNNISAGKTCNQIFRE